MDIIHEITRIYFDYTDEVMDAEVAKRELMSLANKLRAGTALLGELNVWGYDVATTIGENIVKLRELLTEL